MSTVQESVRNRVSKEKQSFQHYSVLAEQGTKMSANIMSSLSEDNRDLRKQIGCMNGIFQIFDRRHFITGGRINKKLLTGGQHQQENSKYSTKANTEKEKPRISMESSRPSNSSSSSSTFSSSFDSNRTPRQSNIPETPSHLKPQKGHNPSLTQSLDLRDLVKDSMYREPRGLSIKSLSNNDNKSPAMKHIDSPRPLPHSKSGKSKESNRVLANNKVHDISRISRDDRLLARFSYDGRETYNKSVAKELPRLSLDSRVAKASAVEPRLKYFEQEPARPSGVVARLMGLEPFPDTISTPRMNSLPQECPLSHASTKPEKTRQNLVTNSPKKATSVTKPTARPRCPSEPAPWKKQDSESKKAPKDVPRSVYGEMEKRITQLQFNKSGKDLRALKQILEAMKNSRERLEHQAERESTEFIEDQEASLWKKNTKTEQMPTIKKPGVHKPLGVSGAGGRLQNIQTQERRYQRENSAYLQEAQVLTPRNRTLRGSQQMKIEYCTTSGRNFEMVSPRLRKNTTASPEKRNSRKKLEGKCSENRQQRVRRNLQLSDDQLSEVSSETRYSSYQGDSPSLKSESNYSHASQMEIIRLFDSTITNGRTRQNPVSTRQHMKEVELAINVVEQPSPVSVLDSAFYIEDSPSPVKKILTPTAFREEDGSQLPDEDEWNLGNLNHLMDCKTSSHGFKYNQKVENMKHLRGELRLLNSEPGETSANTKADDHNNNHGYINKILQTSGLLKDANFISKGNHNFSSSHLINPEMFHVLEQTESMSDWVNSNHKGQRRIVFDMVNEILVAKVTSAELFTLGRKKTGSKGLLKDIYAEIERLHGMSPCCDHMEEDDGMVKLLANDLTYNSEDWAEYGAEVPALVLDIERQIFKDLINEVVTGAVMSVDLNDLPKRHCRQLFTK